MISVLFIYGSTSGNTELVVQKVASVLGDLKVKVTLQRAEWVTPEVMRDFDVCVLASPTYGHGLLQRYMVTFMNLATDQHMDGGRFAVIGLGDDKYDAYYNVESATILEDLIKKHGGTVVLPALRINRNPVPQLNTTVARWAKQLKQSL